MDEKNGTDKEAHPHENPGERGSWSIGLESKEHKQTQAKEADNYQDYPRDEIDRELEDFRNWAVSKFKEAKLVEIVGMVTALALTVLGLIGACIYFGELEEMRRTNQLSQRAWIGVQQPIIIDSLDIDANSITAKYVVGIKNFGPSVGLNAVAMSGITDHSGLDAKIVGTCRVAEDFSNNNTTPDLTPGAQILNVKRRGQSIFPGEIRVSPWIDQGPAFHNLTVLYLVGCVKYRDQFDIMHTTRFCFETQGLAHIISEAKPEALVYCSVYNDAD